MDFTEALFFFLGGALCHAFFSRLMGINIKVRLYRAAIINCLGIMKYASKHGERFLLLTSEKVEEEPHIREAVKYWQNLSVVTLKNSVPPEVWSTLGIKDWDTADRVLRAIEKVSNNDEI